MLPETTPLNRRGGAASVSVTVPFFACLILTLLQAPGLFAEQQTRLPLKTHGASQVIGTVWAVGKRPPLLRLPVFKNMDYCGASVPDRSLLVDHKGRLQAAAVILEPLGQQVAITLEQFVLDNLDCAFTPRVQIVPAGSSVVLKNSDPILHAVHARLGKDTLFNVGLPRWRQVTQVLKKPGVVAIDCDVLHTWMRASVVVTLSPYFGLTDKRGYFHIESVPAGLYDLVVWHEILGWKRTRIKVPTANSLVLDVMYAMK